MKKTRFKQFFLAIALLISGYANVMAQCPPGTAPSNYDAVTTSATFWDNPNFVKATEQVVHINSAGGTTTADLAITVDAQGSIQVKYDNAFQFYNQARPSTDITGIANQTYNTFALSGFGSFYGATSSYSNGSTPATPYEISYLSKPLLIDATNNVWQVKLIYGIDLSAGGLDDEWDVYITEIITYKVGDKFLRRDRKIVFPEYPKADPKPYTVKAYDLRDSYFNNASDGGFGMYSTTYLENTRNGIGVSKTSTSTTGGQINNNLNFVGVTSNVTDITKRRVLGLLEITSWKNWNVGYYTEEYPTVATGGDLDNQITKENDDIGHNVQYGDISVPATGLTTYISVYDVISSPCPPYLLPDVNAGFISKLISGNVSTNDSYIIGYEYKNIQSTTSPSGAANPSTDKPTLNANGTYDFITSTPGTYYFEYDVCPIGQTTDCVKGKLEITVANADLQTNPIATAPDFAVVNQGSTINIPVLANDKSLNDTKSVYVSSVTQPTSGGTVTQNADGTVKFTPTAGFTGSTSFTYTACEGPSPSTGNCKTETVSVMVNPSSAAATIIASDDLVVIKAGSTTPVKGNVTDNDFSTNGVKIVSTQSVNTPGVGTLNIQPDGSYTFTPASGFSGTATFPYGVNNGSGDGSRATLIITAGDIIPLPVAFGEFSARIVNGQLVINWSTLMEKDFDHFLVEVSNDGVNWKLLDKVSSKGLNGNSETELKYSITKNLSDVSVMGITFNGYGLILAVLLGIGFAFSLRNRNKLVRSTFALLFAVSLAGTVASCQKPDIGADAKTEKVFVRITSVDKDGKTQTTRVVQAVVE